MNILPRSVRLPTLTLPLESREVMRMKRVVTGLLLSLLMLNAASAGTIYAVNDYNHTLITIDPVSLGVTTVGSLGVASGDFGDLAYDGASGTMWWVAGRGNDSLYTINLATGAATLVGSHGIDDLFALGTVGGKLYGQATSGNVYELNPVTAAPTLLGSNSVYPGGYDWNPDAGLMVLLAAGDTGAAHSVDLTTGAASLLSAGAGFVNDNDIAYDGDRGIYWVGDYSGNLFKYDASWSRTTLLTNLGNIASLEYVSGGAPVPAPGALLLAGTGVLGVLRLRRKLTA